MNSQMNTKCVTKMDCVIKNGYKMYLVKLAKLECQTHNCLLSLRNDTWYTLGTLGAFSNRVLTFLVEVLKNKDLQDLVEVADGGSIQVLLAVVKGVPHRRKRSRNEMENPDP